MTTRIRLIIAASVGTFSVLFFWAVVSLPPLRDVVRGTSLAWVWGFVNIIPGSASMLVLFGLGLGDWLAAVVLLVVMFIQWFLITYLATKLFEFLRNQN